MYVTTYDIIQLYWLYTRGTAYVNTAPVKSNDTPKLDETRDTYYISSIAFTTAVMIQVKKGTREVREV